MQRSYRPISSDSASLKVVFYTRPSYLDSAFPLVSALCERAEVHLIVEVSPEGREGGVFPLPTTQLPGGLLPVDALPGWLPPAVQDRLQTLASFHLAVYTAQRAFYPGNVLTCWQVARYIRSLRPHILHLDEASSRAASLPHLLPDLRLVVSIHDSRPHLGEQKGRFGLVRRLCLGKAQALVFHSAYSQKTFADMPESWKEKVHTSVVPLGICVVFRACGEDVPDADGHMVLFFGRIAPYKGLEVLLEAAPLVAQRVPGLRLVVAGRPIPGYQVPQPPQLANGGTCECHLGHIPYEETRRLFAKSSLVVLPYLEASQSGVIATAYAFRRPVVTTAVGGLPEMVEHGATGYLVPPRDPEALASAIAELLLNPARRRQMADNIRAKEQGELSWERLAEMTLDVYGRVLRD